MPTTVSVTARATYPAAAEPTFAAVTAEDVLPKVLPGTLGIPAVTGTTILLGPEWDQPGYRRQVHLADGSMTHEEITEFVRPSRFAYRVTPQSGLLKLLCRSATGEWDFEGVGPSSSTVTWTYSFEPRAFYTRPIVSVMAHTAFHRMMTNCLRLMGPLVDDAAQPDA